MPLALGDPARAAALAAALALMTGRAAGRRRAASASATSPTSCRRPVLVGYAAGAALILIGTQLPVLLGVPLPRDAFFLRVYDARDRAAASAIRPRSRSASVLIAVILLLARASRRVRPPRSWRARSPSSRRSRSISRARGVVHLAADRRRRCPRPSLPDVALRDLQALAPGAHRARAPRVRGRHPDGAHAGGKASRSGRCRPRADGARRRQRRRGTRQRIPRRSEHVALGDRRCGRRARPSSRSGSPRRCSSLFVLFLAPALDALPRVALAGDPRRGRRSPGRHRRMARRCCASTAARSGSRSPSTVGVLLLGVLPGVLLGVGLSLAHVLHRQSRDRATRSCAGCRPTAASTTSPTTKAAQSTPGVLVYRLYAPLLFANARYVAEPAARARRRRRAAGCAASCSTCRPCRTSTSRRSRSCATLHDEARDRRHRRRASRAPTVRCASSSGAGSAMSRSARSGSSRRRRPRSTIS